MDTRLAVVGGGPVGAALGLLVPGSPVLEKGRFPRDKPCGEGLLPSGVRVLRQAGIDLAEEDGYPALTGVSYRLPDGSGAGARFSGEPGRGVRRSHFDSLLAERARVVAGCTVSGLKSVPGGLELTTSEGVLGAEFVAAADGARSGVARTLGWWRPGRGRFGLVGHLRGPSGDGPIEVTLMGGWEAYRAPVGRGEVLVAILAGAEALRVPAGSREERYRALMAAAHPELAGADLVGPVHGAGPFGWSPEEVARGRIFLVGDAAGFPDPLTGDGISAGLEQAAMVARLLNSGAERAAIRYRRWYRSQWRRRRAISWLARHLSGRPERSRRALAGMRGRPQTLQRLLELNQGSGSWAGLRPRDWAALLGAPGR